MDQRPRFCNLEHRRAAFHNGRMSYWIFAAQ